MAGYRMKSVLGWKTVFGKNNVMKVEEKNYLSSKLFDFAFENTSDSMSTFY